MAENTDITTVNNVKNNAVLLSITIPLFSFHHLPVYMPQLIDEFD
jgi:hypothetical protein